MTLKLLTFGNDSKQQNSHKTLLIVAKIPYRIPRSPENPNLEIQVQIHEKRQKLTKKRLA